MWLEGGADWFYFPSHDLAFSTTFVVISWKALTVAKLKNSQKLEIPFSKNIQRSSTMEKFCQRVLFEW